MYAYIHVPLDRAAAEHSDRGAAVGRAPPVDAGRCDIRGDEVQGLGTRRGRRAIQAGYYY